MAEAFGEVEQLAALKRSIARARRRNRERLAQQQQLERELVEAYAERLGRQAQTRREERQGRLEQLSARARSLEPKALLVDQDPTASALLRQRPSLRQRLRYVPGLLKGQKALLPRCSRALASKRTPRSRHPPGSLRYRGRGGGPWR